MSFFESLRWQAAPKSFFQQMSLGWTIAMVAALCSTVMAQSTPNAQESIKKALQSGQLDLAAKIVQQERERNPKDVQMRFMEGVIQAQQGQTDKAIDTFKNITQSHPELSEAYNNLGVLYASKGRLEESRSYLEKALQTHPSYAAAHRNLSDVHSQLAKQSYAKALQVDPKVKDSPPQLTLLGSIGPEKRSQPTSTTTAVKNPATTHVAAPSTPASTSAVSVASTTPPTPTTASAVPAAPAPSKIQPPVTAPVVSGSAAPTAKPAAQTSSNLAQASASTSVEKKPLAPEAALPKAQVPAVNKAVPAVNKTEEAAIQSAIAVWAKAWSQKDMPRYLSAYADNFVPAEKMSRPKWESDRRLRIVSKKSISVEITQVHIALEGQKATVRFQQIYESDNFKGNSRKTLEMHKQGQRWLIVRETVN
ncbi:MAG: DUF4440 domain-containing protein [Comamonadaceae bacterium PBBC1]|nr:MAG: DUF4440 domain-containing protein [Comamonadaceae bacterium PBBC1]